ARARAEVDTFQPDAMRRVQEALEKSDKLRGVHLSESIEQAQQNVVVDKTTAQDINLVNRSDLSTLGQTVKLPQAGAWGAKIIKWLPRPGANEEASNEETGREYLIKQQAAGNPKGPESEFLRYRKAVQADIQALTHEPYEKNWSE